MSSDSQGIVVCIELKPLGVRRPNCSMPHHLAGSSPLNDASCPFWCRWDGNHVWYLDTNFRCAAIATTLWRLRPSQTHLKLTRPMPCRECKRLNTGSDQSLHSLTELRAAGSFVSVGRQWGLWDEREVFRFNRCRTKPGSLVMRRMRCKAMAACR